MQCLFENLGYAYRQLFRIFAHHIFRYLLTKFTSQEGEHYKI